MCNAEDAQPKTSCFGKSLRCYQRCSTERTPTSPVWAFGGIGTFAHLNHVKCLTEPTEPYDIAIVGAPFDTAVTYRPGARFGPRSIRHASGRQHSLRGYNPRADINPYQNWAKIVDCGDIPITPIDNNIAQNQMTQALEQLGKRKTVSSLSSKPKLFTLGGDHSLTLPALRALKKVYGDREIQVLHFDAHLDTWNPNAYPSYWGATPFNHGSMFWLANQEGLLSNSSSHPSVHAGLRTRLSGIQDNEDDTAQNWIRFSADDIDKIGTQGIIDGIMKILGTENLVYLSVDIDVLDPAFAPGTGTPEPGGWSTREFISILRGIEGLNLVGADVVEVSPVYQGAGEETTFAAAQVVYEILTSMVKRGLQDQGRIYETRKSKLVYGESMRSKKSRADCAIVFSSKVDIPCGSTKIVSVAKNSHQRNKRSSIALATFTHLHSIFAFEKEVMLYSTTMMDLGLGLQDDVIVVTGAGGQIGQVIVDAFLNAGCFVGGFELDKSKFAKQHKNLFWVEVDTTDETGMAAAFKSVEERFNSTPTICVCAAAVDLSFIEHHSSIINMPTSQFRRTLDVNATGTFITAKLWLQHVHKMVKKSLTKVNGLQDRNPSTIPPRDKKEKNISLIIIGSEAGDFGVAGNPDYAASKSAIQFGLVLSLAPDAARIHPSARVNSISPGAVDTKRFAAECDEDSSGTLRWIESEATVAQKKAVDTEGVAKMCLVLASNQWSPSVTGQNVRLNGGKSGKVFWSQNGDALW
ncbi:hypothetical protein FGRMN_5601 [Fusarium graminum]|nr:hypothetical protein FGRMN_5601 [Fusarium graminum]